jgi:hypothetical protein
MYARIANAGTIYGASGSTGILLKQGGSVFNAGTIEHFDQYGVVVQGAAGTLVNTGLVYGFNRGVALYEGGSVVNHGEITGGGYAVYVTGGAARVANLGSISGFLAGVRADDGGTVVNAGSIFSAAGYGVTGESAAGCSQYRQHHRLAGRGTFAGRRDDREPGHDLRHDRAWRADR